MSSEEDQIDATIEVVTPENIAFQYQVAGPFRRLPAFLIDLAIRAAFFFALLIVVLFVASMSAFAGMQMGIAVLASLFLAWFVLQWFYGGLFETYMNGQTPGKWVMGIRVLTVSGQPINGLQAVMRNILRMVDFMPPMALPFFAEAMDEPMQLMVIPTFMIGLVAMLMNRRFQRLGDIVCGTMVVIEEKSWLMGIARLDDPRAAQLAEYLPVNYKISRSLAHTLATYVERRRFFSLPRRREIARHLGDPLLREFGLPGDTSHDLLLCALYYRAFIADRATDDQWRVPASPFGTSAAPTGTAPHSEPFPNFTAPPLPQEKMSGMRPEPLPTHFEGIRR
jgi:uncharacterized RDD family membrane protein YckC